MTPLRPDLKITSKFNKFAGKEIPMNETTRTRKIGGEDYTFTNATPADPADPTLEAMKKLANDNGYSLRVWFPDMMGTMDFRTDRINAHVEKCSDGKYRVTKSFSVG